MYVHNPTLRHYQLAKVGSDYLCADLQRFVHGQNIQLAGSYQLWAHLKRRAHRCEYNPALTCQFYFMLNILISAKTDLQCAKCQQNIKSIAGVIVGPVPWMIGSVAIASVIYAFPIFTVCHVPLVMTYPNQLLCTALAWCIDSCISGVPSAG